MTLFIIKHDFQFLTSYIINTLFYLFVWWYTPLFDSINIRSFNSRTIYVGLNKVTLFYSTDISPKKLCNIWSGF